MGEEGIASDMRADALCMFLICSICASHALVSQGGVAIRLAEGGEYKSVVFQALDNKA